MSVIERAIEIHYATFPRADVRDGLAHPFGAVDHEPYCWRVAPDVWDELVNLSPKLSVPSAAPIASDRLLGEYIIVDASLAPGAMVLEPHDGRLPG